jgi:branched-chain amino acid transport system substrate-binding protein
MIFYGGEYPEGGVLAKNMAELGMRPPAVILMGGDGMVDKTFIRLAGAGAQGHYATSIGASAKFLPSAKKFVDDYKAKNNAEDYGIYGPTTYDAAAIVIEGAAKALTGRETIDDDARTAIISAIQSIKYTGALGPTTFDQYGDTTNRVLTMNRVEGTEFKELEKLTVK